MRVGVLTGGGDCPGLNAVIRAVGRQVMVGGGEFIGVRDGWHGLVEGLFEPLGLREISGLLPRGGTIIGTTRTNPYKVDGGVERVRENVSSAGLDALVVGVERAAIGRIGPRERRHPHGARIALPDEEGVEVAVCECPERYRHEAEPADGSTSRPTSRGGRRRRRAERHRDWASR